ncbi:MULTISPECIES: hypothetical protein [Paenibacillus]|uniref:hypothetical protein n=1 Tax=Paenibacillus TaxID=44249 RepID=UPI00096EDBDB|nr:hypothetical protein [Paenibacillus sp. FSL H8-0259]OMF33379.1 hypothetical protein BK132_04025 [Paenibacillus sp. FSL H8-0259]
MSNHWNILSDLAKMAERNVYINPNTSLIKQAWYVWGETITKYIGEFELTPGMKQKSYNLGRQLGTLNRQDEAAFKDPKLESYHSSTEIFELPTLDDDEAFLL